MSVIRFLTASQSTSVGANFGISKQSYQLMLNGSTPMQSYLVISTTATPFYFGFLNEGGLEQNKLQMIQNLGFGDGIISKKPKTSYMYTS